MWWSQLAFFLLFSFLGKGMIKAKPPTVWQAVRDHMTRHVYDRMLKVNEGKYCPQTLIYALSSSRWLAK